MALPLVLFVALAALWLGLEAVTLAAPLFLALPLSLIDGLVIAALFVVGHDAAHNCFTRSRRANGIVGRLAFLPSLHAFTLWDLSHNRTHHRNNNVAGIDYVWEPMTPAQWRAASSVRRAIYRFYRGPAGVPFYYLFSLWIPYLFIPGPGITPRFRAAAWADSLLVVAFLALEVWAAAAWGQALGKNAGFAILVAVALPFLFWNGFMSFVIYLHHTHPSVRWYRDEAAWEAGAGALFGTVCVRFPRPFRWVTLNIMEHNAHHLASGVPLYNVTAMQRRLEEQGGLLVWNFSLRGYLRVCQRCKLYDYDAGRWCGFDEVDSLPWGRSN